MESSKLIIEEYLGSLYIIIFSLKWLDFIFISSKSAIIQVISHNSQVAKFERVTLFVSRLVINNLNENYLGKPTHFLPPNDLPGCQSINGVGRKSIFEGATPSPGSSLVASLAPLSFKALLSKLI